MADPLSIGASIVAFIQLADRVLHVCKYCIDTARDAPRDIQIIFGEVTSLRGILCSLSSGEVSQVPHIFLPGGPIDICQRCLTSLEALLPRMPTGGERQMKHILTELAWPLKETKARRLLAEISQQKATLLLALNSEMAKDIKDIKSSMGRVERTLTDSERRAILHWFESTCNDPSTLHIQAFDKHEPHTSSWLPKSPEWTNWLRRTSSRRLIWIHGIPGSGKTVLASFIIEQIREFCHQKPGRGYVYYYCHHSHDQDEGLSFLRWAICQLCRKAQWVPLKLKELYDLRAAVSIAHLEDIMAACLSRFDCVYVVVDAVDESSPRNNMLAILATLATDNRFQNLSILATSREYFDIEMAFGSISCRISMSNTFVQEDIRIFLRHQLETNNRLKRWAYMMHSIEEQLTAGAQGMFRWVVCQIHLLERLRDESQIWDALQHLPKDLGESYVRIFQAIPEPDWPFVRRALLWIAGHARAPWLSSEGININVLLPAVTHDLGVGKPGYSLDDLMELCGCLISVTNSDSLPPHPGLEEKIRRLDLASMESGSFSAPQHVDAAPSRSMQVQRQYFFPHTDIQAYSHHVSKNVAVAHYTVLEFVSQLAANSPVAYFAFSDYEISEEFTKGVYRHAIGADPTGNSTDWVGDREAYCLTLACTLNPRFATNEEAEFFIQYYNPLKPHARRFRSIQERIACSEGDEQSFWLGDLSVHIPGVTGTSNPEAITLLNLLIHNHIELAKAFARNRKSDLESIVVTNTCAAVLRGVEVGDIPGAELAIYDGTISQILHVAYGMGSQHVFRILQEVLEQNSSPEEMSGLSFRLPLSQGRLREN